MGFRIGFNPPPNVCPTKYKKLRKAPSSGTMLRWLNEGRAKTEDGCWVEHDGVCPHGKESLILKYGLI